MIQFINRIAMSICSIGIDSINKDSVAGFQAILLRKALLLPFQRKEEIKMPIIIIIL